MEREGKNTAINITLKKGTEGIDKGTDSFIRIDEEQKVFLGDSDSPFLAPRGVFVYQNKLLVSDTGQNRVFIWNEFPKDLYQKPDLVIGQATSSATGRNAGGQASPQSLQYPSGIWTDGQKLIVADAWNHRVLIWNSFPKSNNQPSDVVLGQDDFSGNQPNKKGVNEVPSANSLYWPYGITVWNGKLFVADTGNRRVLVFNSIPLISGANADHVIGQENFSNRDYDSDNPIWPYSVSLSKDGKLAITDTQYYRVLLWENWEDALKGRANALIGQPDFFSNGQNQFGLNPGPNTLNWCYFSTFFSNGILVCDTGNSRILWFHQVPRINNVAARSLIGKPDFFTGSEFADTVFGTERSLYWPFSLSVNEQASNLVIADTGNHRIITCKLIMANL
jgi:hypothetical protein